MKDKRKTKSIICELDITNSMEFDTSTIYQDDWQSLQSLVGFMISRKS